MAEPVLKWAGGKRQLLDEIYSRFPAEYDDYHEPFFGGGAVFFDLEPADGTINDTNPRLVNFYRQVRDRPEALVERLRDFEDPESKPDEELDCSDRAWNGKQITQYYYQQRARFNRRAYDEEWSGTPAELLEEAALLLYLNRTCYNGLYRENSDGGFNVPIGRYADPNWVQSNRIQTASRVLRNTDVREGDFEYVLEAATSDDLVYLDPPYEPMSATANFAEYSAEGFGRDDQERLLETVRRLDDMGVWIVLSNSAVLHDMYAEAGFTVELEGATRSINSDETNRDGVDEILVTNVPEDRRQSAGQTSVLDY